MEIQEEKPSSSKVNDISVKKRQSLRARYVYGCIFLMSNLFAWVVRDYGHTLLIRIHYVQSCTSTDGCLHAEGILRVSFGCFIFFTFMFTTTYKVSKIHEVRNSWHSKWWSLKFVLWITSMMIPILIPFHFILIYGEIARYGAGIFLVLQLVSIIQFLTWCKDYFPETSKSKLRWILGLFLSTVFYAGSLCGILTLFLLYSRGPTFTLNLFFITWTMILVISMTIASLHSKINTGLLSSGIMSSYVIFLCWSAIRSEPLERNNLQKQIFGHGDSATAVVSFLIAICAIVITTFSTGINSKAFQFRRSDKVQTEEGEEKYEEDDGDDDNVDVPYKYAFFHFVFAIGSMYFAMLFTSWELDHPSRKWSIDVGWASTCVKIINEWFAASLYLWTLIYPAIIRRQNVLNVEESQLDM